MTPRTALVTGATGMLGSYIVATLAARGWRVRALVRDPTRAGWLAAQGTACVAGDIRDATSVVRAARGCDTIFHAAAEIGPRSRDDRFRIGNVVGTSHVIDAAVSTGARLLHVSSTAVYSRDTRRRFHPTTESAALGPLPDDDAYGRTKSDAERLVLDAVAHGTLWASVIRPPLMYGVRDRQFVPRFAPTLTRGVFPLVDGGRAIITAVHAGSVADGAILAATTDAARGRVYNLTNDVDVTVADFVRLAAEGLAKRIFMPRVPYVAGRVGAAALTAGLVLAGKRALTPHVRGLLDMLTRDNPFVSARARDELGWHPAPDPAVVIPEAFRWWRDHSSAYVA